MSDLWVFGYGSLMWRPGFAFLTAMPALVHGLKRSFCVYSVYHRGTLERPGLVLGLDQGGTCHGMAYRVAAGEAVRTIAYLRAREQVTGVYREVHRPVALDGGRGETVTALCYRVERAHPQYAGGLSLRRQADIIRVAHGHSGGNADYLANAVGHLVELALRDRTLERLQVLVGRRRGEPGAAAGSGPPSGGLAHRLALSKVAPAIRITRGDQQRFSFRRNLAHAFADRARRSETRW